MNARAGDCVSLPPRPRRSSRAPVASQAFIYVLCSLGVRASFTKVFGHKAPKNPKGSFMQQLMNPDPSTMGRIAG